MATAATSASRNSSVLQIIGERTCGEGKRGRLFVAGMPIGTWRIQKGFDFARVDISARDAIRKLFVPRAISLGDFNHRSVHSWLHAEKNVGGRRN